MYVLLYGAIKNFGDFLIWERSRDLIRHFGRSDEMLELPRWQKLDPVLHQINQADAIILCGGPGYGPDFFPGIFPLVERLDTVKPPIVPLGLGWCGRPVGAPERFSFSPRSLEALQWIHERIHRSSVRDVLTEGILRRTGIDNVVTTGCPAWYHLPSIERDFVPPKRINRIVVTAPARAANYVHAGRLLRFIRRRYPRGEVLLSFHRGIIPDRNSLAREGMLNMSLAAVARAMGFKVINAAYSTRALDVYAACDLHIGYRVHAHIAFLSLRKPSVLIQEDGRGEGQSATLGTRDVPAQDAARPSVLASILDEHEQTNYEAFTAVTERMRRHFRVMSDFLTSL